MCPPIRRSAQILASPNYPRPYPGGLECLHVIRAQSGSPGAVVTLEVQDLDLEPVRDLVLVRDGDRADSPALAVLSGRNVDGNPHAIVSTGPALYVYTQTDQADSRKGYRFRYYEGCDMTLDVRNGTVSSPAFGSAPYPHNQECTYRIRHPEGNGRVSMAFMHLDLHPTDVLEVSRYWRY